MEAALRLSQPDLPAPRGRRSSPAPAAEMAELSQAVARGDRSAFDALYARFSRGILAFFRKRGVFDHAASDELAQAVWLAAWQACSTGRYDPERSGISTFLYAIALKIWLRHLRDRSRSRNVGASENQVPGPPTFAEPGFDAALSAIPEVDGGDPSDAAAVAERLEALRRFLANRSGEYALTDDEHAVVTAAAAGASDRELASRLGVAASTVNARKQGAYGKIRRALNRLGFRADSPERTDQVGE